MPKMSRCCGSCLRVCGYLLVPLIAILAYFHLECIKEKELLEKTKFNEQYDPDMTDVTDYNMTFCRPGVDQGMSIGIEYMLFQSFPCAIIRLISKVSGSDLNDPAKTDNPLQKELHQMTFVDARKNNPGSFHETGFTLIQLDQQPLTKDWRSNKYLAKEYDIDLFQDQMEPYIKQLYPDAKRLLWTSNVVRGGDRFMDQPKAVDGPHLDFHQNRTARIDFHNKFPPPDFDMVESRLLMGEKDTEDEKLKVMLGIWVPIVPDATVCDNPLAIMDARTFFPEHQAFFPTHINFGIFMFHNLAAGIEFHPKQMWYYYPFMTTKEVLVFHQYSEDKFFANPHTSFNNKNCPKNSPSRISVEMRLALYF